VQSTCELCAVVHRAAFPLAHVDRRHMQETSGSEPRHGAGSAMAVTLCESGALTKRAARRSSTCMCRSSVADMQPSNLRACERLRGEK
jgi:hypothetical protein